jgi:hypothetical protein
MNNDPIYLISQLKGMFPNFDDEILLSALFQNNGNIEKTIDCLLGLQADNRKIPQKEISLFNNIEGMSNKERSKSINETKPIPKPIAKPISKPKETNMKAYSDNQLYIDDNSPVVNKLEIKETKPKKSVAQKIGSKIKLNKQVSLVIYLKRKKKVI